MRITPQEEILAGKTAFERWADTFGVKINRYHSDHGNFSEKPFRSAIEDANQTITFLGVGSHHENVIFERKNQTITLGSRRLFLHTKRYWPEAITAMLLPYALKAFSEKLNVIKVDDYGMATMDNFAGTTIDINPKNHQTWGCPVYALDKRLRDNIAVLTKL